MPAFRVSVRRGGAWRVDLYVGTVLPTIGEVVQLVDGSRCRVLAIVETADGAPVIECEALDEVGADAASPRE